MTEEKKQLVRQIKKILKTAEKVAKKDEKEYDILKGGEKE